MSKTSKGRLTYAFRWTARKSTLFLYPVMTVKYRVTLCCAYYDYSQQVPSWYDCSLPNYDALAVKILCDLVTLTFDRWSSVTITYHVEIPPEMMRSNAGGWCACAGPPVKPRVDRCVVDNWQRLTCWWKPSTEQQTLHMLHYSNVSNEITWTTAGAWVSLPYCRALVASSLSVKRIRGPVNVHILTLLQCHVN